MTASALAALMHERGWGDTALARLVGVHRHTVWRWRTGRCPISESAGRFIINALGQGERNG